MKNNKTKSLVSNSRDTLDGKTKTKITSNSSLPKLTRHYLSKLEVKHTKNVLEEFVYNELNNNNTEFIYEDKNNVIPYVIPASNHSYLPDFTITRLDGKKVILETKGLLDKGERDKYRFIKYQHPDIDIRFIFDSKYKTLYKGSNTTYEEWCIKHGFKCCNWNEIPSSWFDGTELEEEARKFQLTSELINKFKKK